MRKYIFSFAILAVAVAGFIFFQADNSKAETLAVYKSPTCGCCVKWIDHMEDHGYSVESHDMNDVTPIKKDHGVPINLRSCHTTLVNGYVIEGHVPSHVVDKLLKEMPEDIAGIAVPGMPMGSPGMEGPNPVSYEVIAFNDAGQTKVYAEINVN